MSRLRAEGSWLYCADGRRYLDMIAGIGVSALGHGYPAVLEAIERQARRHLHVMVYGEYVIEVQAKIAERYGSHVPMQERVISPAAMFDAPQLETVYEN